MPENATPRPATSPGRSGVNVGTAGGLGALLAMMIFTNNPDLGPPQLILPLLTAGIGGVAGAVGNTARNRVKRATDREEDPSFFWELLSWIG